MDQATPTPSPGFWTVPRLSPFHERLTQVVAVLAWCAGLYWIVWRWRVSLNWSAPAFSLTLVLAETYGLLSSAMLVMTVFRLRHRAPPPALENHSVDVFITCYDEPVQLLRRTALAARAIRYPHQTYILDDGRRAEVRDMAGELGIGYLRRNDNAHAKAGNLNHALEHTQGEFILQLDADHVPLPHVLDRMLGYFSDPDVAFVQSPQDFYNTTDSFTHVINDEGHRMWEENRIFFSLIQPGKDCWNAAFFCGSCGLLRRAALDDVGGFSTMSITEDMETSIKLHARGWRSVYHGETLAFGLAPASAGQYHVQRLRWGQGAMQILRNLNPLGVRGLTWPQRIMYFSSTLSYVDGLQKLIFYLAPLMFLYTGIMPVRVSDHDLLVRLLPYMVITIVSFEMLSRGTGWVLISERYNMTKFFTYVLALSALFTRRPLKFRVTPKSTGDVPLRTYAPQLILAIASFAGIPFAFVAFRLGWISYQMSGLGSAAFMLNAFWAAWNGYFAAYVVRHSVRSRQQRQTYRFLDNTPVEVRVLSEPGTAGAVVAALTENLNTTGLSFRCSLDLAPGTRVEIPLALATGSLIVRGAVIRGSREQTRFGNVWVHGIAFEPLTAAESDGIELHCTQHAVPLWQRRYRSSVNVFRHLAERFSDLRDGRRLRLSLPAELQVHSGAEPAGAVVGLSGLLEEVSRSGARFVTSAPIAPGTPVSFAVPGTSLTGRGTVVFNRAIESPLNVRFAVGVCAERDQQAWWKRVLAPLSAARPRQIAAVPIETKRLAPPSKPPSSQPTSPERRDRLAG